MFDTRHLFDTAKKDKFCQNLRQVQKRDSCCCGFHLHAGEERDVATLLKIDILVKIHPFIRIYGISSKFGLDVHDYLTSLIGKSPQSSCRFVVLEVFQKLKALVNLKK